MAKPMFIVSGDTINVASRMESTGEGKNQRDKNISCFQSKPEKRDFKELQPNFTL